MGFLCTQEKFGYHKKPTVTEWMWTQWRFRMWPNWLDYPFSQVMTCRDRVGNSSAMTLGREWLGVRRGLSLKLSWEWLGKQKECHSQSTYSSLHPATNRTLHCPELWRFQVEQLKEIIEDTKVNTKSWLKSKPEWRTWLELTHPLYLPLTLTGIRERTDRFTFITSRRKLLANRGLYSHTG